MSAIEIKKPMEKLENALTT